MNILDKLTGSQIFCLLVILLLVVGTVLTSLASRGRDDEDDR